MTNRYSALFDQLSQRNQGAFVPFVTLGDPGIEQSLQIIDTLVENGADALELGFPFSDPLADGPVIQAANIRALAAGTTSADCFNMIKQIRAKYPDLPIGLLLYANLVYCGGIEHFYSQAQAAGVDSVLIADVPVEFADDFVAAAKKYNVAPIFIAPPNADTETLTKVSNMGQGYTYLLSRAGVTGTESAAGMPIETIVAQLAKLNAAPPLLGFGIAEPAQVQAAIAAGAAGAISGSAVVKIIANNYQNPQVMQTYLADFTLKMKAATQK
ncbi:tryptophan synthase subunit alpha [Shewanella marina]|uniref:tryptophan synthase subunit alpha n=1 Tax=Shewanella marina TaxID=487319 RepID=UPI0004710649|nr:tryptophan synthase subunit alpha [Shewanella marina]